MADVELLKRIRVRVFNHHGLTAAYITCAPCIGTFQYLPKHMQGHTIFEKKIDEAGFCNFYPANQFMLGNRTFYPFSDFHWIDARDFCHNHSGISRIIPMRRILRRGYGKIGRIYHAKFMGNSIPYQNVYFLMHHAPTLSNFAENKRPAYNGHYSTMSDLAVNRRATFDYEIIETYEAGIALQGFEVKAVKAGRMNLAGTFAIIRGDEAWLVNASISPYQSGNTPEKYDPTRPRRLLLHKKEIKELIGATAEKGLTIVPLKVYAVRNRIKIAIALARHKKKADKRETIKRRESDREIQRTLKWG